MAKENKDLKSVFASRKAKEEEKTNKVEVKTEEKLLPFVTRFGQEKLDAWKKQHNDRELIYLKVDNALAVLRPPMANDLGDYMTAIGTNGMDKAVAMIVEQLWLDGDYSLIEDEDSFIAVFLQVNNILEGKKAEFFRF
jgi:hypothetical protein